MKLSKILFLMLGILLSFSFVGCDDFSLRDALYTLDGVTLTIENETENDYFVKVGGIDGVDYLEGLGVIDIQIFYGYNSIALSEDGREVITLRGEFYEPSIWVIDISIYDE